MTRFIKSVDDLVKTLVLALVAKYIDTLLLAIMQLDAAGRILAEMLSKTRSPIRMAQSGLAALLASGEVVAAVCAQFKMEAPERLSWLVGLVRQLALELSGAIYYRIDLYLLRYPFWLLHMVHPDRSYQEQKAAAKEFFEKHMCCLDPFFSGRLRELFKTKTFEDLFKDTAVMGCLLAWLDPCLFVMVL